MGLTPNDWTDKESEQWGDDNSGDHHNNGVECEQSVGLANLGNTCFENAIFQSLFNHEMFCSEIILRNSEKEVDSGCHDDRDLVKEFVKSYLLYKNVKQLTERKRKSIRLEKMHSIMTQKFSQLSDGRQHDAQEFLALLLDSLHEQMMTDMTMASNKRIKTNDQEFTFRNNNNNINENSLQNQISFSDHELASREWTSHRQRAGVSVVSDTFQGQLCSCVTCNHCHFTSKTFEPFMFLALPIPFTRHKHIQLLFTDAVNARVATRFVIKIENKYENCFQIKQKLKELLSDEREIAVEDLVITEVTNQFHVSRVVDDYEDIISLNDSNTVDVHVFELKPLLRADVQTTESDDSTPAVVRLMNCIICLDDKPLDQLFTHSSHCTSGLICDHCFDVTVRHYTRDHLHDSFNCPTCQLLVFKHNYVQSSTFDWTLNDSARDSLRTFCIPVLFRKCWNERSKEDKEREQLVYKVLMVRVHSQQMAPQLYALIDALVPNAHQTYRLVFVERHGFGCCRCSWSSTCEGCELSRAGTMVLSETDTICVLFDSDVNQADTLSPWEPVITCHKSYTELSALSECAQSPAVTSIDDCLQEFIANECLSADKDNQWFCRECATQREAHKSLIFSRPPNTLIVYLKRFFFVSNGSHGNHSYKLNEKISFPVDSELDLTRFVSTNQSQETTPFKYKLQSVVCHFGNISSGHYTCYAHNTDTNQWFYFNDENVSQQKPDDSDARAYILFYCLKKNIH